MNEGKTAAELDDFLKTERTGRRNAVPDIVNDETKCISTTELSSAMETLAFTRETCRK